MFSAFHVYFGPEALTATPRVRRIGPDDCVSALKEGFDDFFAMPTYPIFVGLFYAVAGIALFAMTSFGNALHLAFPLAAGFALIGPFVAIGLYEMSRRRDPIPSGRPEHRSRVDLDRRGGFGRLLLRRACAGDQRRLIPADA